MSSAQRYKWSFWCELNHVVGRVFCHVYRHPSQRWQRSGAKWLFLTFCNIILLYSQLASDTGSKGTWIFTHILPCLRDSGVPRLEKHCRKAIAVLVEKHLLLQAVPPLGVLWWLLLYSCSNRDSSGLSSLQKLSLLYHSINISTCFIYCSVLST